MDQKVMPQKQHKIPNTQYIVEGFLLQRQIIQNSNRKLIPNYTAWPLKYLIRVF